MKEPTDAQIKKLWEWYGFKLQTVWAAYVDLKKVLKWTYPDSSLHKESPSIDLNNLFKYIVPMPPSYNPDVRLVQSITFDYGMCRILDIAGDEYVGKSNDPALALFWALWEVKEAQ